MVETDNMLNRSVWVSDEQEMSELGKQMQQGIIKDRTRNIAIYLTM